MISYNTRELTLRAIESLFEHAGPVTFQLIVWDNNSRDGSADAIAQAFPTVALIRSSENVGFAQANNAVAAMARTEWLLLLNPDTEVHPAAVANLLAFAKQHPDAGIVGGRTVYPDGSLNPASCWNRMTCWGLFCSALGLSKAFPRSSLLNPEGIGGWRRDSVRRVDIVVGCFFLISRSLWEELGGFRTKYFMYGEESDMCLRARRLGFRPMITPDAQIMHLVGASTPKQVEKRVAVMRAKATLIRDHWHRASAPVGLALLTAWSASRRFASAVSGPPDGRALWAEVWRRRKEWLAGY